MRYEQKLKSHLPIKGNVTADKIIEAAKQLFRENKYESVTTREIASKADVNLGLIPYYFTSKENLARIVFKNVKNELYQAALDQTDISELGSAEVLYVISVRAWYLLEADPAFRPYIEFYYPFLSSGHGDTEPSGIFTELSWKVIKEYGLEVTPSENELYLTALTGAEQLMTIKVKKGLLNVTYNKILNLVLSNYFYNLGLSDQTIANIIMKSNQFLDHYPT